MWSGGERGDEAGSETRTTGLLSADAYRGGPVVVDVVARLVTAEEENGGLCSETDVDSSGVVREEKSKVTDDIAGALVVNHLTEGKGEVEGSVGERRVE